MTETTIAQGPAEVTPEQRAIVETAERNGHAAVREPLVYGFENRQSYFRDLALRRDGSPGARERLERHDRQMLDAPRQEKRTLMKAEFEYRVNPSTVAGHGGEFAPPLWLNQLFATAKRPSKVIQELAPSFDLPQGVSSVSLPRMTTGTRVYQQQGGLPVEDRDVETATVTSNVGTFAGQSDWSLQSLEQSPAGAHLDWVVFKDLVESLDSQVEYEMIIGTGKEERLLGLTELSGTNSVVYTSATPSGSTMFPFIGQAMAKVGAKRLKPPEAILMNSSRFFWLSTSEDNSNRPLLLEDYQGSEFPIAGLSAVGVYPNDVIGQLIGGLTAEQDVIIVCRPSDFVLLLSDIKPSVKLDVLSGTMTARFQLHRYVAALLGRYPSGISILSGTGMKVQEGYK